MSSSASGVPSPSASGTGAPVGLFFGVVGKACLISKIGRVFWDFLDVDGVRLQELHSIYIREIISLSHLY